MKTATFSLLLSSAAAFSPAGFTSHRPSTSLDVSVVTEFVKNNSGKTKDTRSKEDEQIVKTFETESPRSVGVAGAGIQIKKTKKRNNRRRKHNFKDQAEVLKQEPDLDFFTLHSSAVSHLSKDMPINDILRAIKRAQNLHDVHDLATIAGFLIEHCDKNWGYGFRGSLLSRVAVAALHANEVELAQKAIDARRVQERPSMLPHESAAIVRGLMRVGEVEEGWNVLEDELRLPMEGTDLTSSEAKEILKHRARSLASIASRHFYEAEPYVAATACKKLGLLGGILEETDVADGDLDMPWSKLIAAASACEEKLAENHLCLIRHIDPEVELPADLAELVWSAMLSFPCPGDEEECSVEDYLTPLP